MQDAKNRVEAVLFTTGRFLNLESLSKLTSIGSVGYLKQVLQELKESYEKKNSALEIINEKDMWRLNIRKEFLYLTESLLSDAELDKPTQETLAIIAYRQPAVQSDVTNIRGNKSYDHIKKLKEEGFLTSERFGRTRILKVTSKFYDYFDVVEDNLKLKLEGKEVSKEEETGDSKDL